MNSLKSRAVPFLNSIMPERYAVSRVFSIYGEGVKRHAGRIQDATL